MELSWSAFKTTVVAKDLLIQSFEDGFFYYLVAFDDRLQLRCKLNKDNSADTLDYEINFKNSANKPLFKVSDLPFKSKQIGSKKLYKRLHGIQEAVVAGVTTIIFPMPYPWAKITGIEIIGGVLGDHCSVYVLDSTTGTYTSIPNFELNQFGFNINVAPSFYRYTSEFDSDLYENMQIKIVYTTTEARTIGINFNFTELK